MARIALEIRDEGKPAWCRFVGKTDNGSWKAVKSIDEAEKWQNEILASGAISQYLSYLRKKFPSTSDKFSLKSIECD